LALPSNIGRRSDDRYSFTTHGELKLRYLIGKRAFASVGYDYLWWDDVARPGNQIDRTVDPRQSPSSLQFVPGFVGARPAPQLNNSGIWIQGLSFELGLRF